MAEQLPKAATGRKGRSRKVIAEARLPTARRYRWRQPMCRYELTLACGHKRLVTGGEFKSPAKFAYCPDPNCNWPGFVDCGAGI